MAFESMDDNVDGGADVAEFVESAESDIIEMDEANNNIQGLDDGMDEAEETADTLDKMGESLGEAAEDGGISEPAAEAVRVAVEHLCARIGMPAGSRVMPSMENFGDRSSRVTATMEAMDGIKDRAKSIWEAIVKVFNQAIDWVKDFFRKLTDGSLKLKKRAETIAKNAKALGSKTIKADGKVSAGGFAKQLAIDGKAPVGTAFAAVFETYTKKISGINASQKSFSEKGKAAVKEVMATVTTEGKVKEKANDFLKIFELPPNAKQSSNNDFKIDDTNLIEVDLGLGNKSYYCRIPKPGSEAKEASAVTEALKNTKMFVADKTGATGLENLEKETTPLSKEDVISVADKVKTHMDLYKDFAKEIKALEESRDSVRKGMDKLKNAFSEDDRTAARLTKVYISAATAGASALRSHDIKTCKAALDYCAASLKSAGAPEAKKEGK